MSACSFLLKNIFIFFSVFQNKKRKLKINRNVTWDFQRNLQCHTLPFVLTFSLFLSYTIMRLNKDKLESEHLDPPFLSKKEHSVFGQHAFFFCLREL